MLLPFFPTACTYFLSNISNLQFSFSISLSFSQPGSLLCGVGLDRHGKSHVVLWNTAPVAAVTTPTPAGVTPTPEEFTKTTPTPTEVTTVTQAHTDVAISTMKIAHFDEKRYGKQSRCKAEEKYTAPLHPGQIFEISCPKTLCRAL